MARIRYRITIRGRLTEHLRLAFDGLGMEPGGEQTALVGEIRDQAHLYGVLDLVRELGLELVSVAPDARQNQSLLSERDRGACLPQNPPARPAIPLRTAAVTHVGTGRVRVWGDSKNVRTAFEVRHRRSPGWSCSRDRAGPRGDRVEPVPSARPRGQIAEHGMFRDDVAACVRRK